MPGVILKEQTFDRHDKAANLAHRYLPPRDDRRRVTPEADRRVWYKCVPDSSGVQAAPAFGVIEVVDVVLDDSGQPVFRYQRPSEDNMTAVAVLGGQAIPSGATSGAEGRCTLEPAFAAYNTAATPAFNEEWGTEADSYLLKQGNTGFRILGAATEGRVLVRRPESAGTSTRFIEFELAEPISVADATASADVVSFWGGADPGGPVTLANLETSTAGTYVFAGTTGARGIAVENTTTGEWPILQMQCG